MKKILLISILLCVLTAQAQYVGTKPPKGTQLDRANSRARGLVGYWLMNEGGGNTVYDISGNGNHGTLNGDTSWTAGKYGSCLSFDGTGDYVNLGDIGVDEGVLGLSVSTWVKVNAVTPTSPEFIASRYGTGPDIWYLQHETDDDVSFVVYNNSSNMGIGRKANGLGDTNWHHVVGIYNGSNVLLYVDGVLGTKTQGALSGPTKTGATTPLTIGSDLGLAYEVNGSIDNVMIYNRALSAREIQSLYADPFQLLGQPKELYVSAGEAPPAGNGQVIPIMITSASWWLAAIILMTMAGCYLKRKAA